VSGQTLVAFVVFCEFIFVFACSGPVQAPQGAFSV